MGLAEIVMVLLFVIVILIELSTEHRLNELSNRFHFALTSTCVAFLVLYLPQAASWLGMHFREKKYLEAIDAYDSKIADDESNKSVEEGCNAEAGDSMDLDEVLRRL